MKLMLRSWSVALHSGVLLLSSMLHLAYGANVLAVLPSVWKSHYLFGRRLLQQLVTDQHNYSVTIISPHAAEEGYTELPNIREIRIEGLMENWLEMGMSFDAEQMRAQSVMERFTRLIYAGTTNVDLLLSDAQVRKLLTSGERFDLLFVDLFLSDALLGLSRYYDIPTVAISPTGANSWLNYMLGNPHSSALDPSSFLPFTERMNFWERSINTLMSVFERMTYNFFHLISQQSVYYKHFETLLQSNNAEHAPHYRDLTKNLSLALINSHPALQYPRAYLPNIQEIGGSHLHAKSELQLPKHLQKFIESAPQGVVYISLGANVRFVDLPREKLEIFVDIFSDFKDFHFLLKWETLHIEPDLPKNVMTNSWFPQEAILAHANVKVFISSCGLLSIVEAVAGHTPILAIPILPDQEVIAKRLTQRGVALTVPYDFIAYDALLYGIRQLVFNESYAREMTNLAKLLLHSSPTPGMSKVAHFIDLALNSGGLEFLKSHANSFNFWRAELLDVLAILTLGISCILAVPFLVICCILRKSYYSQEAASQRQTNNCRLTLNAMGRGNSFGGQHFVCNSSLSANADGEPLRRTRSAYSLSVADSNTTTSSSTSLTSFDLTPPPVAPCPRNVAPIQLYTNHACYTETGITTTSQSAD